jgi:thymidylate kinase
MALGRATLLRKHDLWQDYGSYVRSKGQAMRLPFLAWPYVGSVWLDYLVQIWFKLLFHLPGQGIIVLDRYLYDTVINDLAVHLNYSSARMMRAIGRGLKLLPRPMVTILLDLPVEVAFARKTDVPHVDYLRERYSRYLELCTRPEVERLDGEALPKDLVDAVLVRIAHSQSGGTAQ